MQARAKAVAERLRVLIIEKGWNQSELARRSGMRPSNISNYLRGSNVPNPKQLAKLAEALGTTPADILNVSADGYASAPALALTHVEERDGRLRLQIDQVVPAEVASQVIELLLPRAASEDETPRAVEEPSQEACEAASEEASEPASGETEAPALRACGRNILETLMPAKPPTPINAKQIRPLDGPAPLGGIQKTRKVG